MFENCMKRIYNARAEGGRSQFEGSGREKEV
jgi:hypothetical protein